MTDHLKKEWYLYTKRADFQKIGERFGIEPVAARVLRNRDLITEEQIDRFLNAGIEDLYDAAMLPDGEKCAKILSEKIRNKKKIRIVGDYDADGVCASYVLWDALLSLGADCSIAIPDRIRDGYGINSAIVSAAVKDGVDTIITCDNGISACEELKAAADAGLTVIITDHHEIRKGADGKEILPPAAGIVNVCREDSAYPEKELCGTVTAWKFVSLLFREFGRDPEEYLKYLEFAALATICDCIDLKGENRIIAKEGLRVLSAGGVNTGMKALIRCTGLTGKKVTCYSAGFVLGPCINAGGRMETAERAFSLFASPDAQTASERAAYLVGLNESRKELTAKGTEAAVAVVEKEKQQKKVLVVSLRDLHESLAGIVAGRLKEYYGRPAFVFTASDREGIWKGSGRSVEAYNMFEELAKAGDLLQKFGGHPMAAGLSVREKDIPLLEERLNTQTVLTDDDLKTKVWIDSELPFSRISEKLVGDLEKLEPFGGGNEKPRFALRNVHPANFRVMGRTRNALRMDLYAEDGIVLPGIMFGDADALKKELETRDRISILFYPVINEWNGYRTLNVQIEDYR